MSFRYRRSSSNKKEDWVIKEISQSPRRTVPTISEPRKTPFRLCSAIAIVAIVLALVVTATFVIHISHKNVLPFALLTKQERFLQMKGFEMQRESKESKSNTHSGNEAVYIEDVVLLPDEVVAMVLLSSATSSLLGQRSMVVCVYSDKIFTEVNGIEYLDGRAAVRCQLPEKKEAEAYKHYIKRLLSLKLLNRDLNRHVRQINKPSDESILKWDFLIYESFSTSTDVVLFAKGLNHRQGVNTDPESLRCVYNGTVETAVTVSSQEVFRCKHPNKAHRSELLGTRISLRWQGRLIPSVAYYQQPQDQHREDDFSHREVLCSCTMVFNVTKFLKEWVTYHSHLGVGHFFLYDNNSEDNLEGTVAALGGEFNVTRHPWPWVKTQEAGFSHCALLARNKCQWMVFADVDEFIFSPEWLDLVKEDTQFTEEANKTKSGSNPSQIGRKALESLVMERSKNITDSETQTGQISINCNNFGASGLKVHPERGVTQGYTCREKAQHRHKSIVLLEALSPSLLNVIHHFQLKPGYTTDHLRSNEAVINHYKYQAWSEFKSKFRRRVSAYVVDWTEAKNAESQDRTPGLGKEAIEPPDWENRFCEVNDTALRDFNLKVFSSGSKMLWQL
ncbi:hypothetical protein SUGI_0377990 [Cryptomeria japonica]|uniref:glycosyltransferase family 92 protein RCOM_0530710 n=1 Tax=Cryptomeria japonica TaxID=3369 RepID=UPI002408A975|nr:glycosyltransferase family 92 protein RCOM_0530710 [Cryptomeria japonica]GLJ20742.1 hypothetical protein SUGI_0377990 [Cryptomeria japonica]